MNQEVKTKWLEALRSNNYKQGKEALKQRDQFCCLGVLCDLYAKEKNLNWTIPEKSNLPFECLDIGTEQVSYLPEEVRHWAEFEDNEAPLAIKNDGGWSFSSIAEEIENNY